VLDFLRFSATHPMRLPELPAVQLNQVQEMIIPARQGSGWISGSALSSDDLARPNESGAQILLNTATIKPSTANPRFNLLSGAGLSVVFLIVAGNLKAGR
jgi:hypothetical protein